MKVILSTVLITLFAIVASPPVSACGDSLHRVGKGVAYRGYTAPLPGSVLIYGNQPQARQLAEQLAASGHEVRFIDDAIALDTELQAYEYDVVIAPLSEHRAVEIGTTFSRTTFLPVAMTKDEAARASSGYEKVMIADRDDTRDFLKAIHRVVKRNRG
ncbi:hypothetical protein [Lentisalinibacter sediminis]|uniref:hypothetical protein n=1 Tax=Lentisalinibacter sediminis TaxID=2992237 RepID=UPI00386C6A5B